MLRVKANGNRLAWKPIVQLLRQKSNVNLLPEPILVLIFISVLKPSMARRRT